MKRVLNPRREPYLAKFSVFLIMIALIAGMVGCAPQYNLTISTTTGGNITITVDGEETVVGPGARKTIFDITEGIAVNLTATPQPGYRFDSWTGQVADVNAAATTVTVNTTYSITARFIQGLEIRNWYDLDAIRTTNNLGGSHIMINNLDSTTRGYEELASPAANGGEGWQPIVTFNGTFDGRGYKIKDLFINRPDATGVGLFGYADKRGVVLNVTVVNATVTGNSKVGGLVGSNEGKVENSYSSGSVTGENSTGGLVGWNQGTILNSYATGSVSGGSCMGGLVGYNKGTEARVSGSNSTSTVSGDDYVAGLVGWNEGAVSDSYSAGSVNGAEKVGGLVGWNGGSVRSSSCSNNVTGGNNYVGGLVGYNGGTVSTSHSSSNVIGGDEHVGGLVGWNEGTVITSHSTGNVKGNDNVGGLVGFNYEKGTVRDCHSSGNVTSEEGSYIGGLVGWNERTVVTSYSTGNVKGNDNIGGLVGGNEFDGTVSKSHSTGNVTGDTHVGGLVGQNGHTVEKSYSTGSVSGDSRVGGLVGYNKGAAVSNSYSICSVAGGSRVGGLVGYNEQSSVDKCYSTGKVTGLSQLGGLVGVNNNGTCSNSFWDTQTSGRSTPACGTGKTTAGMQDITTFSGAAWDIIPVGASSHRNTTYIWNIVVDDEQTYPFLSWQPTRKWGQLYFFDSAGTTEGARKIEWTPLREMGNDSLTQGDATVITGRLPVSKDLKTAAFQ